MRLQRIAARKKQLAELLFFSTASGAHTGCSQRARSIRATLTPVWTMPGAEATTGRLTEPAQFAQGLVVDAATLDHRVQAGEQTAEATRADFSPARLGGNGK